MRHRDLLHTVNNQLEIITSAAELLSLRDDEAVTTDLCSKIHEAVINASAALNAHFQSRIPEENAVDQRHQLSNPAAAERALSTSQTAE